MRSKEHLPPHIHAHYGEDLALIDIRTGEVYAGYLPGRKLRMVKEWLENGDNRILVEARFYEINPGLALKTRHENEKGNKKDPKDP